MLKQAIDKYLQRKLLSFHSPVHGGSYSARDLSEMSGLDDLQYPSGAIEESQKLIADLFGARDSFLLVNGASVGLMAAILALRMQYGHGVVLLARNVHKSVISGVILAGFDIEWFEPEWISELGCYGRFEIPDVSRYIGVVVTNPTYEGFHTSMSRLDIPVIVDEAHGAHYQFSGALPQTALKSGADICVQSWHKCLGSLTQTGVLHLNHESRIDTEFVARALRLLQSTSPSYLLMESLTSTAELLASQGSEIINHTINTAREIEIPLANNDDPLRANFYISGFSGEQLIDLFEEKGIALEKYSENSVLAFINLNTTSEQIQKLNQAYKEISAQTTSTEHKPAKKPSWSKQAANPRKAFLDQQQDLYAPCPPGIATLVPGQAACYT